MFLKALLTCHCIAMVGCAVTEKDLEAQLGIDLNGAKEVSWKDFVNNNPAAGMGKVANGPLGPPLYCIGIYNDQNGSLCGHCNENITCSMNGTTMDCNGSEDGRCLCKLGFFPNIGKRDCEDRPKKELGQPCDKDRDNCYAAFATCVNGHCSCKDGFKRVNDVCRPLKYACPYKTPLLWKGIAWPCISESTIKFCPKGYTCIAPADSVSRPQFLTASGVQQGYCCPMVPDIRLPTEAPGEVNDSFVTLLNPVCFYGKADKSMEACRKDQLFKDYYHFHGIGLGDVCCPSPCYPDARDAVVVNGKCTFPKPGEIVVDPVTNPNAGQ